MKGRIKNIYKRIIKYPVTIWMVASILTLVVLYPVLAAYNGTAIVKRVVSTQSSSTSVFSSNYMEVFSTNIAVKNLRTINEGDFICPVTVCNYDQLDPTSPAKGMIVYNFTAELVRYDSGTDTYVPVTTVQTKDNNVNKTFYVTKVIDDNQTIQTDTEHSINSTGSFSYTYLSETLEGDNPFRDTYNICFDATEVVKDVPDLFIKVTATPTAESSQQNNGISNLASIISISQGRTVETGWHGSLQETSTTDYDGYNMIIEGSGAGTIEIQWDNTRFTMNPVFVSQYGGTGGILTDAEDISGQTGWKKRTLTVDSATGDNRYVVQFYKNDPGTTYTGNEYPSKYIKCVNYVQNDETTPTPSPEP